MLQCFARTRRLPIQRLVRQTVIRHGSNRPAPASRLPRDMPASPKTRRFHSMIRTTLAYTRSFVYWSIPAVLVGHIFLEYFYTFGYAYGVSMLPYYASYGETLFLSQYYRRGRGIKVGDVVCFRHPVHEGEHAVKRVIGIEGDLVLMNTPEKSEAMIQVPTGHCWVVGDNLLHSRDSRHFGPLPMALITGKVVGKGNWLPDLSWSDHGLQPAYVDDEVE